MYVFACVHVCIYKYMFLYLSICTFHGGMNACMCEFLHAWSVNYACRFAYMHMLSYRQASMSVLYGYMNVFVFAVIHVCMQTYTLASMLICIVV